MLAYRLKRGWAVMVDPGVSPGCVRFVTLEISPSMTMQGERLDAVVAEAVAGDRNALREVLETIRPIVVRYCRARVGTVERSGLSADDVAQEVCLAGKISSNSFIRVTESASMAICSGPASACPRKRPPPPSAAPRGRSGWPNTVHFSG